MVTMIYGFNMMTKDKIKILLNINYMKLLRKKNEVFLVYEKERFFLENTPIYVEIGEFIYKIYIIYLTVNLVMHIDSKPFQTIIVPLVKIMK